MFFLKLIAPVLIFISSYSQAVTCSGFANYQGVRHLFQPGQNVSKNLGALSFKGYQNNCNRLGQCSGWKEISTRMGLYWEQCTQSTNGTCHYEPMFEYVSLAPPSNSAFLIQFRQEELALKFNLPDSKGNDHRYICRIDKAALANGKVTCVQSVYQNLFLTWNSSRLGLSFDGQVSNSCIQVASELVTTNSGVTSLIRYEISGIW